MEKRLLFFSRAGDADEDVKGKDDWAIQKGMISVSHRFTLLCIYDSLASRSSRCLASLFF